LTLSSIGTYSHDCWRCRSQLAGRVGPFTAQAISIVASSLSPLRCSSGKDRSWDTRQAEWLSLTSQSLFCAEWSDWSCIYSRSRGIEGLRLLFIANHRNELILLSCCLRNAEMLQVRSLLLRGLAGALSAGPSLESDP